MPFSDTSYNLRIELDTKNCQLSPGQLDRLEKGLAPLRKPVEKFPVSSLYITVYFHPRSNSYRVKTALALSGKTLTTGDLDEQLYPAYERCVRKLVKKLLAYEADLGAEAELRKHQKGTHQDVMPQQEADAAQLKEAVDNGDYTAFRDAIYMFEEPIRKRVGRWVQRYPEVQQAIGTDITLADLVEEVFLNAFERYDERPGSVRLGNWLEDLIDPSIKLVMEHPDEELENIRFARTLRES